VNAIVSAATTPIAFGHREEGSTTGREIRNLEAARQFLAAIERSTSARPSEGPTPADFLAPDVEQIEYPNRFVPTGATRGLAEMREAGERGRKVLRGQRYDVRASYAVGDTVILEVLWVGTLAVAIGTLQPGSEMRAHFAVFMELRDGRIVRQRNYDCFEPF
jgi:ketosteroid isomerase-like protein